MRDRLECMVEMRKMIICLHVYNNLLVMVVTSASQSMTQLRKARFSGNLSSMPSLLYFKNPALLDKLKAMKSGPLQRNLKLIELLEKMGLKSEVITIRDFMKDDRLASAHLKKRLQNLLFKNQGRTQVKTSTSLGPP